MRDTQPPFEEIFRQQVSAAARKVCAATALPASAIVSGERELLRLVTSLAAWPLLAAFHVFPAPPGEPASAVCRRFTDRLLSGGLDRFLAEFPLLSQLIPACIDDWIAGVCEFSSRLNEDRGALVRIFGPEAAAEIAGLDLSLSDRHGGRTVVCARFTSGLKLIYKPRDMSLERCWFALLDWLNRRGAPGGQRVVQVLERPGYGWEEFIPAEPADGAGGEFSFRAGALQCLMYVLNGTDAHMGNVIASGSWPVLVDAECLLQPARRSPRARQSVAKFIEDHLHSGLLPRPSEIEIEPYDLSGLTGRGGQLTDYRVPVWGKYSLRFVTGELLGQSNLPGHGRRAELRAEDFLQGFSEMHAFLEGARGALLARGGPLQTMFACPSRVLLHSTRYYMALMSRSLRPRALRDPAFRSDMLRKALAGQTPSPGQRIVEAEAAAIQRLNIPYFASSAKGRQIVADGKILEPSYFETSGREVVAARVNALNRTGRDRHVGALRVLFAMRTLGPGHM